MNVIFRVVFGIIVVIIFLSIVLSTFFMSPNYLEAPKILPFEIDVNASGSHLQQFSLYETLYSNADFSDYDFTEDGNIGLYQTGAFLSSLRNPGKKYVINGKGFSVIQEGVGEIYIDTITVPGKVFILPINTSVHLILESEDKQEQYTDIYLSPNMYLEFQPDRAKYLKNADRLRISTVFKIGYVGNFYELKDSDVILKKYLLEDSVFFDALNKLEQEDEYYMNLIEELENQSIVKLPGYEFIERYTNLFVNTEKKKVFYKNNILEGYISLLAAKTLNEGNLTQIQKDLQNLKNIDEETYNELLGLQGYIAKALYADFSYEGVIPKILFAELASDDIERDVLYYPFYTYSLFTSFHRYNYFIPEVSKKFFQSFQTFSDTFENNSIRYDYFLYFLEQQLSVIFDLGLNDENIESASEIILNYVDVSGNADYSIKNQKITQIYSIGNILQQVEGYIKAGYFLEERDASNLLLIRGDVVFKGRLLSSLKNSIESLYGIYEEDKIALDENSKRDNLLKLNLEGSKKLLDEYLLALENYERYEESYDISKKTSLGLDTFGNDDNDALSKGIIIEYLSQFIGSSVSSISIEIKEDHYVVKNYIVSGRIFDFEIHPDSAQKMGEIYIDGIKQTTQYKLELIEDDWGEKRESAPSEERDKYDFTRFFLITFFSQTNDITEIYVHDIQEQEDKAEIVFKRDILLGDKGEFSSIQNIFNIEYDNISLIKRDVNYDIFLDNALFNIDIKVEDKNLVMGGYISSEYVFSNEDHYFSDLRIKFLDSVKNNEETFFLGKNEILLQGNTHISDIENTITGILYDIEYIDRVYSSLLSSGLRDIQMTYNSFNQKTSLKFDSGSKNYTILLQESNIDALYIGTQRVSGESITLDNLLDFIK